MADSELATMLMLAQGSPQGIGGIAWLTRHL